MKRQNGFTLFEIIVAMLILSVIIGAIIMTLRVSTQTAVLTARNRNHDRVTYALIELLRTTFRTLPAKTRFQAQYDKLSLTGPSWILIFENCPEVFAFGEIPWNNRRTVLQNTRTMDRPSSLDLVRVPLTLQTGETPVPLKLLQDIQKIAWQFFDPRTNSWHDDWQDTTFRPSVVSLTLQRVDDEPITAYFTVVPAPGATTPN